MSLRNRILLALICTAVLSCAGQENASTLRAQTDLVLIPTHVRLHGKHLSGLSKEDFSVLQDGQLQRISVFEEVRPSSEKLRPASVAPGEFTNSLVTDPKVSRYVVIAIDRINTTAMDMNRLRDALSGFLARIASSDEPIGLIAINPHTVEVVHDFTSDPKVLKTALDRNRTPAGKLRYDSNWLDETLDEIGSANTSGVKEREQAMVQFQERSNRISSLEALQRIALSLSGLPGHKSLLWVSSGYPFASLFKADRNTRDSSNVKFTPENAPEALGLDEYTMHLLNTANIAVYPVDARSPSNSAWSYMDPSLQRPERSNEAERLRDQDVAATFEHLAASTGGKPCYSRADMASCLEEALEDAREYYVLGYYIDRSKVKSGWHKLQVKVVGQKAAVRARSGFLFSDESPDFTKATDMRLAVNSRLAEVELPFLGRWTEISRNGDKRVIEVELKVPGTTELISSSSRILNLEVAAVARNPDGTIAGQFGQHIERDIPSEQIEEIQKSGITYKNKLELRPGRYLVRIVLRDNKTARLGSVSTPLTVN